MTKLVALAPGEIKMHTLRDGYVIKMMHVAGGSFTYVELRDPQGMLAYCHSHRFEHDARAWYTDKLED